jgi:hypothetical protein
LKELKLVCGKMFDKPLLIKEIMFQAVLISTGERAVVKPPVANLSDA